MPDIRLKKAVDIVRRYFPIPVSLRTSVIKLPPSCIILCFAVPSMRVCTLGTGSCVAVTANLGCPGPLLRDGRPQTRRGTAQGWILRHSEQVPVNARLRQPPTTLATRSRCGQLAMARLPRPLPRWAQAATITSL